MAQIIDADGHMPSVWQEYTEPACRDGVIRGVVEELREACAPLSEAARIKIIGENARRLYRL